jgi:hypothetical protein
MARTKGGDHAVPLDPALAKCLGIGNSTGLGMAPFIVNHPVLFNNWIMAREEALSRVRSIETATPEERAVFENRFDRSCRAVEGWTSNHPVQQTKLTALRGDLKHIRAYLSDVGLDGPSPWNKMVLWAESALSEEGEELLMSLILEPYGPLVDGLADCMADDGGDTARIDGTMTVGELKHLLELHFGWALEMDWEESQNCARAWYVSEEKLEPRLGERFEEDIADYEQPMAPARDAARAYAALGTWNGDVSIADFLVSCPQHRHTVRRAQRARIAPYGEIQDNTISADVMPIDLLRAKLSFFGATRFDPRSDRWVRICMFSGAPYPDALTPQTAEDWVYPEYSA